MTTSDETGAKKEDSQETEKTKVRSQTPENREGHINPSAPEDSNATPGSTGTK